MNDVCAVVPYRADAEGVRRRNAEVVLSWLTDTGIRIVVAEHSESPDPELDLPTGTQRVHIPSNGRPFNKSLACNTGFCHADAPIIALVDADTMTTPSAFSTSVTAIRSGFGAVRPFARLVELDEEATQALAGGGALPDDGLAHEDGLRGGEEMCLCGGIVVVHADVYRDVGGMDESFEGWGGEDDALSAAIIRSGAKHGILKAGVAFHLHHPRTLASRYRHSGYERNLARAKWWHEASDADIREAMHAGAERLTSRQSM